MEDLEPEEWGHSSCPTEWELVEINETPWLEDNISSKKHMEILLKINAESCSVIGRNSVVTSDGVWSQSCMPVVWEAKIGLFARDYIISVSGEFMMTITWLVSIVIRKLEIQHDYEWSYQEFDCD